MGMIPLSDDDKNKLKETTTGHIGKVYGELKILGIIGYNVSGRNKSWFVEARCSCGKAVVTQLKFVLYEGKVSCGHTKNIGIIKINKYHFMHGQPIYTCWQNMKKRCYNKNDNKFSSYGGRGITVCERWRNSFNNFYEDMREGYSEELTLERNNVNEGYSKSNCSWATRLEQSYNKRNTRMLTIDGVTKKAYDWSLISGIHRRVILDRIDYLHWDVKEAVFSPLKKIFKNRCRKPIANYSR